MVNPHIGKLVRSDQNQLGVGKIADSSRTEVVIEYFDSPVSAERPRVTVPWSAVQRVKKLGEQTRVYFFDAEARCWRIGRVLQHIEEAEIFVSLPNGGQARLPEKEIFVRWDQPLQDPWDHLAARLTETPYFHIGRHQLMRELVAQRAGAGGMTGLVSASIDLEAHQIEVVRRVLHDPVQRYLLADEVGLGKTIEAGVILRQHVLDRPRDHCVLVIVPATLLSQWADELRDRCQLGAEFGHQLFLVALEAIDAWTGPQPTFVVVDEAHQAVLGWNSAGADAERTRFEKIRRLSAPAKCPQLLLLSATPIRRNESGFLALLHLLDPAVYDLAHQTGFQQRVEKRQEIADIFAAFTEDQATFFLESSVDQLTELFPGDARLAGMLTELRPLLADEADETARQRQIRSIRSHLSDTYRLHRRMLRNRRNEQIAGILPGRKGLLEYAGESAGFAKAEEMLEGWRSRAAAAVWGKEGSPEEGNLALVFICLFEALWGDVEAFGLCLRVRQKAQVPMTMPAFGHLTLPGRLQLLAAVPLFEGEGEILEEILASMPALRAAQLDRYQRILALLAEKRREQMRVVCIATSPRLVDELHALAAKKWPGAVARHQPGQRTWRTTWEGVPAAILFCDSHAEEGVNLQGQKRAILHIDLPLAPNRLEQRTGRVDRFGSGTPVPSLALAEREGTYATAWLRCLARGWQVFQRSIAALQYVVEDEMRGLYLRMFREGVPAIDEFTQRLAATDGILEKELRAIRNQDELDAFDLPVGTEANLFPQLEEIDAGSEAFRRAFDDWVIGRLQFVRVQEKAGENDVVRYHHRQSDRGSQTLISQQDLVRWLRPAIDPLARHSEFKPPLTRAVAFERQVACHRRVGLARVGNPLVDGIHDELRWDDRGSVFAFWRQCNAIAPGQVRLFFRFDFLVETNLTDSAEKGRPLGEVAERAIRRRADAAFPPFMESVWVGQELAEPSAAIQEELDEPFLRDIDVNLNQDRWPLALERLGPCAWGDLCADTKRSAEARLRERRSLATLTAAALEKFERVVAAAREQATSRMAALEAFPAELEELRREQVTEDRIARLIADGVRTPSTRLDATGVVFLAGDPLK